MKKIYQLTFLILASIIGAGFASGKEVYVFFTSFGLISYLNIVVAFFIFYYSIKLFLNFGNTHKFTNLFDVNKYLFPKNFNCANFIFFVAYIIILSGMFAGVFELYNYISNSMLSHIFVIITAILCVLETIGGLNRINAINNIFMPITIMILLLLCGLLTKNISIDFMGYNKKYVFKSLLYCLNYIGINLLLASGLLLQIGRHYSKKEIKYSSFFCSLILCIIILFFNFILMFINFNNSELPMLYFAFNVNKALGIIVLLGIWFAIFSAIVSIVYVLSEFINIKINCNITSNCLIVFISYLISFFGFSNIVNKLYPIIGICGVAFILIIYLKNKRQKEI